MYMYVYIYIYIYTYIHIYIYIYTCIQPAKDIWNEIIVERSDKFEIFNEGRGLSAESA